MAGTLPPLFTITSDDHGGYVAVAAYILVVMMLLLVATRVFTRWYVVQYIKADDVLLIISAVRNQTLASCEWTPPTDNRSRAWEFYNACFSSLLSTMALPGRERRSQTATSTYIRRYFIDLGE